jgi:hypothetical protein
MPRTDPARYTDPLRATRTTQETARLAGCGVAGVVKLIDLDLLTAIYNGNRRLVTVVSIEKLLGRPIHELEAALRGAPATPPARDVRRQRKSAHNPETESVRVR